MNDNVWILIAQLIVVILAIYLDRITSALASRSPVARALQATAAR